LLFILAVLGLCPAQALAAPPITRSELAPGVYLFSTGPDGYVPNGNSVAIVNDADVVVFDTLMRPSAAAEVIRQLRQVTPKPVRYLINSHWHPDHWSANETYVKTFPGLEIIASEETRTLMLDLAGIWPRLFEQNLARDEAEAARTHQEQDPELELERSLVAEMKKLTRVLPTVTYENKLTLLHGGREFRLMSVVGDARGTTVLYLPKEKILITGDVVSYPIPYFTPPLSQHAKSLRMLSELDVAVLVPGHGPAWREKKFLLQEAGLLESIVDQVRTACRQGAITVDEVAQRVKLDAERAQFAHGDPALQAKFDRYARRMIDNAFRDVRDDKHFE
jgi:cyclase